MPEKGKEAGSADKFMATVRWISMGKAKDADVDKALTDWNSTKAGFTFNTVFKTVNVKDGKCEDGYTMIQAGGNDPECLKLAFKDTKLQAIAARLETRRMAAFLGCTTEFRKWEGFTYDPIGRVAYTSISEVSTGMEVGPSFRDHIQVKKNLCGCVMEMGFNGDEDYQISWIKSLECGKSANETAYKAISEEYYKTNKCDVNFIASPDNVAFIPEYNQLLIGEDTDMHRNNVIWSRDMKTGKLTRILSTPVGAETTGPYWYPNINGFSYITAVIQHPFDSTYDKDKASKSPEGAEDALRGYVGYLGPLPTVSKVYSAAFSTAATVVLSTVVAFAVALFSL